MRDGNFLVPEPYLELPENISVHHQRRDVHVHVVININYGTFACGR